MRLLLFCVGFSACVSVPRARPDASPPRWVATWAASPQRADPDDAIALVDRTVRTIHHVSLGGPRVRVHLSNAYGESPLRVDDARVALRARGSAIAPASDRALTFGGARDVVVPPGGVAVSDPVSLDVPPRADLAVSLHVAGAPKTTTEHSVALATTYVATGDRTSAASLDGASTATSWPFVTGVDVDAPGARALVALGDSMTDGMRSTADANARWTDALAQRRDDLAIANAGISGNRLLDELIGDPMIARFDRDVLAQPGVAAVVIEGGTNDATADPDAIVAGLKQLRDRAHAASLVAIGATMAPCEGTKFPVVCKDPNSATRAEVNAWIRAPGSFDAVADFDRAIRDPSHPSRILPAFDSGDHVHPNDAGYAAMAEAVDAALEGSSVARARKIR